MLKSRDVGEVLSDEELLGFMIEVPTNSREYEPLLDKVLVSLAEAVKTILRNAGGKVSVKAAVWHCTIER